MCTDIITCICYAFIIYIFRKSLYLFKDTNIHNYIYLSFLHIYCCFPKVSLFKFTLNLLKFALYIRLHLLKIYFIFIIVLLKLL